MWVRPTRVASTTMNQNFMNNTPLQPGGWEERFDEKFYQSKDSERVSGYLETSLYTTEEYPYTKIATPDDVKIFIQQLLDNREAEVTETAIKRLQVLHEGGLLSEGTYLLVINEIRAARGDFNE